MANQNYGEVLCQAVDEIVRKRLEGISYDQTILCTIVNNDKHEQGIYTVTNNGRVKFEAVSENTSYRVNDNVYVQIPGGDWDQQKMIIAKKTDKNAEEPFIYRSPFESLVDITGNMINSEISSKGLIANSNKPEFKTKTLWTYNLEKTEEESDDIPRDTGLSLSSYTRLGIKAEFKSLITPFYKESAVYNVNAGDYGLRLILTAASDQTVNDAGINQEYELYLNCADMNGNPYNFQSYYTQEKVFDITNIGAIKSLKLEFYQTSGSFAALNSNGQVEAAVPAVDFFGNDILPNLFVNDPYISLGYDTNEFNTDMVYVYSLNPTTYSRKASNEVNHKEVQLRWVHKDEKKDFISVGLDDYSMDYEIRWYRYELGHKSVDGYAGVYWKEFAIQRRPVDDDKVSAESTWNDTENNWQYIIRDKEWLAYNASVEDEKKLYPEFFKVHLLPDITLQNEQIKVIILYKNQPYRSNTVVFENQNEVVNKATIDAVSALSVVCVDRVVDGVEESTYGNYRIYGQNGSLLNYADSKVVRKFVPYFKLSGGNSNEIPTELTEAESIEWIIPTKKTMIAIDGDDLPEPDADGRIHIIRKPAEGSKDISAINYQNYRIKSYYSQSYNDNTIQCKIVKDNVTYTCTKELTFGTAGTTGTDYTLILDFDNGVTALTIGDSAAVTVTARLYDYENKEVENLGGREVIWSWKINDGKMQFPDNTPGKAQTQEIKLIDDVKIGESYNILQASMDWGDWELIAYLPIPIRANTDQLYISGTTQVIYNSAGEIFDCARNPYRLYYYDKIEKAIILASVTWTCTNGYIAPEDIITEEDTIKNENAYSPTLKSFTDKDSGLTDYYLSPLSFYVEGACEKICVTAQDGDEILWSQPILIMQNRYPSAMLNQWDGSLDVGKTDPGTILAPRLVAGKKNDDNTFSGVVLGDWQPTNSSSELTAGTGLFGYYQGEQSYGFRDNGTAFIGKSGAGRIEFDGTNSIIKSSDANGMSIDLNAGKITSKKFLLDIKTKDAIWDTTNKILKEPEKSIYIDSDHATQPLRIGTYFSVDWDGTLHAAAGEFTGEVNATTGTLGSLTVTGTLTGGTISGANITNNNGTFSVTSGGHLTAKSATIGGWYVRPPDENGTYNGLYSTSSGSGYELSTTGTLKMKNVVIDSEGKITLGPGGNASITIDGTTTNGKITFGTGEGIKPTIIDGNNISVSNLYIYSNPASSNTYAGKIMYMIPNYGGSDIDKNHESNAGIGFSSAPEGDGSDPASILKLTKAHIGASYNKIAYWVLDGTSGFRAAWNSAGYLDVNGDGIKMGHNDGSALTIDSNNNLTVNNTLTVTNFKLNGGTCEGLYIELK